MKNVALYILLMFSLGCSESSLGESGEKHSHIGCEWFVENSFIERGGDAISENSWYSPSLIDMRSITFHRRKFKSDFFMKKNELIEEYSMGEFFVYRFQYYDDDVQSVINTAIITKHGEGYISLNSFDEEEVAKFVRSCNIN